MPLWVLFIVLFLFPVMAQAQTVYIDPTCTVDGNGSSGEPCASSPGGSGPRNSWKKLIWYGGLTYLGKGGTTEVTSWFLVSGSGTPGAPITIGSYGQGRFTFRSTDSYALATINRSYLVFDNVEFQAPATFCVYLSGVFTDVTIRNSVFSDCQVAGVVLAGTAAHHGYDHVLIEKNTFAHTKGGAVMGEEVGLTNTHVFSDITIQDNLIDNVSIGDHNRAAIKFSIANGSQATYERVVIQRNVLRDINDEEPNPVHQIQLVVNPAFDTQKQSRYKGIQILDNRITNGGGGIYFTHWSKGTTENAVRGNIIRDVNATASIISYSSSDVNIDHNIIDHVSTYAAISYIDGLGIDADLGNDNITISDNYISRCEGNPTVVNSGQAIAVFGSKNIKMLNNTLVGNRVGIMIGSDSETNVSANNVIDGNVIAHSIADAIFVWRTARVPVRLSNNIFHSSGQYGVNVQSSANENFSNNVFMNNALGDYFKK